jgi:hypothetical protein
MEAELRVVSTSLGSPLTGPFVPGETVIFRFSIKNYQTDPLGTGNDCQWLQGIIPVFGNGWDPSSFVSNTGRPVWWNQAFLVETDNWDWFPEGEVGYNFPTDEYDVFDDPVLNRLSICKGCTGQGIQMPETNLPSGFFYANPDSRAPCFNAGEDPDDSWGLTQTCGSNKDFGFFQFGLTVRELDGPEGCQETGYDECWVEIFTFTDGEIGCVESSSEICAQDLFFRFESTNLCIPSNAAFRYYNQRDPLCDIGEVNGFEIEMNQNPPYPEEDWPGCNAPQDLSSPHWLTFVANAENIELELEIDNCENGDGVLWSLYELPCDINVGRLDVNSPTTNLSAPFGGCQSTESPQIGTQTIEFSAEPGQLYGILVDGWQGDNCQLELNMINGGEIPDLSGIEILPEFDSELYGYVSDSVCVGAVDVEFRIPEVDGVCGYEWRYSYDDTLRSIRYTDEPFILYDFPVRDTIIICVEATNICYTTQRGCKEVIVAPSNESILYIDTICEGERYTWLDNDGDTIKALPPQNESGLQRFTEFLGDVGLCGLSADLDLFVRLENDENPTLIDTFSCYVPGEEQSIIFFCDTISGIDTVPIQACISPSTGCDTFFTIEHNIIGGELNIVPVSCDGFGNMIFEFEDAGLEGYTPWDIQTNKYANDPDFEIEFIWTTRGGARNLGEGDQLVLPQAVIRQFAENENFLLTLEVMIYYRGDLVCGSMEEYSFSLQDNFPTILDLAGDRIHNLGEENLKYWFRFRNPRNPQHNQSNDRVFVQEWAIPPGFRFLPPSDASSDTIYLAAPEVAVGNSQLCISVTTDQCLFSDEFCVELEQADCPANIISLDSCGVFVFTVEDFGGPILGYQWQVQNGRIIGSSDGPIVVIEPGSEDSTRVSVRIQSDCLGTGTFVIPPSDKYSIVEDLNENPRRIYRRNCDPGSLIVVTESACAYRWGFIDSITNEYVFPLEGPDGNIWEEAYLEISDTVSPFRDYFVERVLDCSTDCESELIFSRSAENISCNDRIFQIYPNPGTDKFKVRVSRFSHGEYQLKFMNIQGQWARTQDLQISQDDQISELILSGLVSGLYQVVIEKDKEILDYQKLIIINR